MDIFNELRKKDTVLVMLNYFNFWTIKDSDTDIWIILWYFWIQKTQSYHTVYVLLWYIDYDLNLNISIQNNELFYTFIKH